jgi:transketolase
MFYTHTNPLHTKESLKQALQKQSGTRDGFGKALVSCAQKDESIVALCADLSESTRIEGFKKVFPHRFFEVGVAEQNLVCMSSGFAAMGKKPVCASYAAFCPGRCWEQIRTTICLNNVPVIIAGAHAGLSVGPDGATHQILEDIALMRSLPNMQVFAPIDGNEASLLLEKAFSDNRPTYIRLSRENFAEITSAENNELKSGNPYCIYATKEPQEKQVYILSTGTIATQVLAAIELLEAKNINVCVFHFPTIKPLHQEYMEYLAQASQNILFVTLEEHQLFGGFGSLMCEWFSQNSPRKIVSIGVHDRFGQSGTTAELYKEYGLDPQSIYEKIIASF